MATTGKPVTTQKIHSVLRRGGVEKSETYASGRIAGMSHCTEGYKVTKQTKDYGKDADKVLSIKIDYLDSSTKHYRNDEARQKWIATHARKLEEMAALLKAAGVIVENALSYLIIRGDNLTIQSIAPTVEAAPTPEQEESIMATWSEGLKAGDKVRIMKGQLVIAEAAEVEKVAKVYLWVNGGKFYRASGESAKPVRTRSRNSTPWSLAPTVEAEAPASCEMCEGPATTTRGATSKDDPEQMSLCQEHAAFIDSYRAEQALAWAYADAEQAAWAENYGPNCDHPEEDLENAWDENMGPPPAHQGHCELCKRVTDALTFEWGGYRWECEDCHEPDAFQVTPPSEADAWQPCTCDSIAAYMGGPGLHHSLDCPEYIQPSQEEREQAEQAEAKRQQWHARHQQINEQAPCTCGATREGYQGHGPHHYKNCPLYSQEGADQETRLLTRESLPLGWLYREMAERESSEWQDTLATHGNYWGR